MSNELYATEAMATLQAINLYRGKRDDPKMLFHCSNAVLALQRSFEARHRPLPRQTEEERRRQLHEIGTYLIAASHALGLHTGKPHSWSEEEIQKHIASFDEDDRDYEDDGLPTEGFNL